MGEDEAERPFVNENNVIMYLDMIHEKVIELKGVEQFLVRYCRTLLYSHLYNSKLDQRGSFMFPPFFQDFKKGVGPAAAAAAAAAQGYGLITPLPPPTSTGKHSIGSR